MSSCSYTILPEGRGYRIQLCLGGHIESNGGPGSITEYQAAMRVHTLLSHQLGHLQSCEYNRKRYH